MELILIHLPIIAQRHWGACQDGGFLLSEIFQRQFVSPMQQGLPHHRRDLGHWETSTVIGIGTQRQDFLCANSNLVYVNRHHVYRCVCVCMDACV